MDDNNNDVNGKLSVPEPPGQVVLFGSGEASASGRRVYDWLLSRLSLPIRVAIMETPAGFQPNSALVAEKVGDFMRQHLRNYQPQITFIPARKRGSSLSPDDRSLVSPIMRANVIFLGPGSPTYAVRQLRDSLAWHIILACHRQGATLVLASAATIAASVQALPVYEIYKAGEDLHWRSGLDLFGAYGLSLVFITHWNNREGGAELDTSRCYMGRERFEQLQTMLPSEANIVGIDEHTALIIDAFTKNCLIMGRGAVTLVRQGREQRFMSGQTFAITELGPFQTIEPRKGIPSNVWEGVLAVKAEASAPVITQPSAEVLALVQSREAARARGDWNTADALRKQIISLGWQVDDTLSAPQLRSRDN